MKLSPPAKPNQIIKFRERRTAQPKIVKINGEKFIALPNVFDTSTDTQLMADSVKIRKHETFIEIGVGTGVVSLLVARNAKSGVGTDINPEAVNNAELNRKRLEIKNVKFILSDVFDNVEGAFNVIICNPPYNAYKPKDEVEMMFWDENNKMKKKFFRQVTDHLKPNGSVYFGWGNFKDLDQKLPDKLAEKAGLKLVNKYSRDGEEDIRTFYVYEFTC